MKSCRGSRCGSCQGFPTAICATQRYINKRYREQQAASPFSLSFPPFVLLSSVPLFLRSLVYGAHFCIYVHACIMCTHLLSGTSPGARISLFLSRLPQFSSSSYFLERKTCTRVGHSVSSLYESSSLISICRLFVFISPFSLIIAIVRLQRFLLYFPTGFLTLKQTSNFESPRTSQENTFDHFYVRRDLVTRLHPFETVKRVRRWHRSLYLSITCKNFI